MADGVLILIPTDLALYLYLLPLSGPTRDRTPHIDLNTYTFFLSSLLSGFTVMFSPSFGRAHTLFLFAVHSAVDYAAFFFVLPHTPRIAFNALTRPYILKLLAMYATPATPFARYTMTWTVFLLRHMCRQEEYHRPENDQE